MLLSVNLSSFLLGPTREVPTPLQLSPIPSIPFEGSSLITIPSCLFIAGFLWKGPKDTQAGKRIERDSLLYGLLVTQVIYCRVGYELLGSVPDHRNKKQWPKTIEIVNEVRQQEEINS